jgi:PAT family beta-lactamase induction signal transducer AmpG
MIFMITLGFSSGLPIALTASTLQAWYTVSGVSLIGIGFLNLVGQPYAYKFLWAPLFDRYIPPLFGRRRGWILLTQLAIVIIIISMAFLTPQRSPVTLAILALILAFCAASQDVNLDAYRTDLLDPEERALGSALWISGYRIAMLVSGALALILAEYLGWHIAIIIMAAFMTVGIVTTMLCETTKTDLDVPQSLKAAIYEPFQEFFTRKCAILILVFIIFYKLGDAFALSLSTAFYLRGVGFSLAEVGTVMKTMTLLGSLLGLFLGGVLMLRLKLYRSLMLFGIFQVASNVFYIWLYLAGKSMTVFATSVFIENLTGGMGTAAFLAFLMALCDKRYTATQLSLLTAFMSVGRIFIGPVAGVLVVQMGWVSFFLWSIILALPGLCLLWYLNNHLDFTADKIIARVIAKQ